MGWFCLKAWARILILAGAGFTRHGLGLLFFVRQKVRVLNPSLAVFERQKAKGI